MKLDKTYLLFSILFVLCLYGKGQDLDSVREYINSSDIQAKEIVLKQSVLETGWYKSYSCRERNNLFGFRYRGEYLVFKTWQESVDYYARWQKRKYKGGDYYEFLDGFYATDPEYVIKLKRVNVRR